MLPDQLLRTFWDNKYLLACAACLTGLVAYMGASMRPPQFVSEGLLVLESRQPSIPELNQSSAAPPVSLMRIRTEADILRSRQLAAEVVERLGLANNPDGSIGLRDRILAYPRGWRDALLERLGSSPPAPLPGDSVSEAIANVQHNLLVRTTDNSTVVSVRYASPDPEVAREVVDVLMERYLAFDLAAKVATTTQANLWLTERLATLRAAVDTAEARVQALRRESGLTQTSLGTTDAQLLRDEQERLALADRDLARAKSARDAAMEARESITSPSIEAARAREAEAAQLAASLAGRFGDQHPARVSAVAAFGSARNQTNREIATYLAGLQREVQVAESRQRAARDAARLAQTRARDTGDAELALAQLTREADARRQIYVDFLARTEQTQLASAQFPSARIISPAFLPTYPAGIRPVVVGAFAGAAGLLFASAIVFLRRTLHRRVDTVPELIAITGRPNAACLPTMGSKLTQGMAARILDHDQSSIAETLRAIQLATRQMAPVGQGSVTLVVSPENGDGKTTLAAAMARLAASDGLRTLIIEADMRRPRLAQLFGKPAAGKGLEALLEGRSTLAEAVTVDTASGLHCLLSNGSAAQSQRLLDSPRFTELLAAARQQYQFILVDTPPILQVADSIVLAPHGDALLFVAAWHRHSREALVEACRRLPEAAHARMATVFSRVPLSRLNAVDYYRGNDSRIWRPRLPGPAIS